MKDFKAMKDDFGSQLKNEREFMMKHGDKKYSELSDKLKDKFSRKEYRELKGQFGDINQNIQQRNAEVRPTI